MKKLTKAQEQALNFINKAKESGFTVVVKSDSCVAITKDFTPGDSDAFVECDMFYDSVLSCAPLKGGSVFGTDGGSVGGYVGLKNGRFVMNKTGSGVNFIKALRKLI